MSLETTDLIDHKISSSQERKLATLLSVIIGGVLAIVIVPSCFSVSEWVSKFIPEPLGYGPELCLVLLGATLYVARPVVPHRLSHPFNLYAWMSLPLPLILALLFGWLFSSHSQSEQYRDSVWLWSVIASPLAEELIFRGWVWNLIEKLWPKKIVSLNIMLPFSLFFSSLMFSLWHIQNMTVLPWYFIAIQLSYTFVMGIWLGYIYILTGNLWVPFVFHSLVNLSFIGFV